MRLTEERNHAPGACGGGFMYGEKSGYLWRKMIGGGKKNLLYQLFRG